MTSFAPDRVFSSRRAAGFIAAALCSLTVLSAAEPNRAPLAANESLQFTPPAERDMAATVTLQLARNRFPGEPPATGEFTIFSDQYRWWSGPMKTQSSGDRVTATAQLPANAMDSLLIAERAIAAFPGGPENVVEVTIPRADLIKQLGDITPPANHAVFFNPPPVPDAPTPPPADASRAAVEDYAGSVKRWHADVQGILFELNNDLLRARGLWTDLQTAGRLPWKPEVVADLGSRYGGVERQRASIEARRAEVRQQAEAFVNTWNTAHSGETPVDLKFESAPATPPSTTPPAAATPTR